MRDALARGDRLMGFGHRVYKTEDPRAEELREMARIADPQHFALAHKVEELALALLEEQKPGRRLYTNVEFYSAVVLSSVGLPGDLFTPTFAARSVQKQNILVQPSSNLCHLINDSDYSTLVDVLPIQYITGQPCQA
jgi:citrate synthase